MWAPAVPESPRSFFSNMKKFLHGLLWVIGLAAASCGLYGQSVVVGVRASYTGGGSTGHLDLGDPIYLSATGSGSQEANADIQLMLDQSIMFSVSAGDLSNYQITFSPPAGYGMTIEGVRT